MVGFAIKDTQAIIGTARIGRAVIGTAIIGTLMVGIEDGRKMVGSHNGGPTGMGGCN